MRICMNNIIKSIFQRSNGLNKENIKAIKILRSLNFEEKTIRGIALDLNGVNIPKLARTSGVSVSTLYRTINKPRSDNEEAKQVLAQAVGVTMKHLFNYD